MLFKTKVGVYHSKCLSNAWLCKGGVQGTRNVIQALYTCLLPLPVPCSPLFLLSSLTHSWKLLHRGVGVHHPPPPLPRGRRCWCGHRPHSSVGQSVKNLEYDGFGLVFRSQTPPSPPPPSTPLKSPNSQCPLKSSFHPLAVVRVLDPEGAPVRQRKVWVGAYPIKSRMQLAWNKRVVTDDEGYYNFSGLTAAQGAAMEDYRLVFACQGVVSEPSDAFELHAPPGLKSQWENMKWVVLILFGSLFPIFAANFPSQSRWSTQS